MQDHAILNLSNLVYLHTTKQKSHKGGWMPCESHKGQNMVP